MSLEAGERGESASSEMTSEELLKVMRIRDFLSLILTYPMTLPNQNLLSKWKDGAQEKALTYEQSEETNDRCMNLLSEKPLRYLEVLIPNEILSKIEDGQTCIFHENDGSKGKQVVDDDDVNSDHLIVPEAMRKLAVDLAIDQLIKNLPHCDNIDHFRFFTRNIHKKRDAWGKMRESLLGGLIRRKINAKYLSVLWVDVLKYHPDNAEDRVLQQIAEHLGLLKSDGEETEEEEEEQTINYDHDETEVSIEELVNKQFEEDRIKFPNKPYLLFVVDGDGKGNLDPMKLSFFKKRLATVVLITNTENDQLRMSMDLEIRTEDHVLPWQLFSLIVGSFQDDEYLQGIAAEIVDKCRGHLLAIALVARSLKHQKNNDEPWENARKILHESSPNDMLAKAFTKIVLDGLNHQEKLCLACSLYMLKMEEKMENHSLVSSWVYYKIVPTQEKAELVMKNLVDRFVLWQIMEGTCVQIQWPAEIYNVLESLLGLQPSYKIRRGGLGLTEPPAMEEWVDAQEMELMDNKLTNLPSSPSSPNLWKLLLQGNADLREIPPSFFTNMPLLEVLNLSYTNIMSLPSSIFELKRITELCLQGCKSFIKLPPEIKRLSNLTILDLQGTPIMYLPPDIKEMTLLQELKLSFYNYDQQRSEISPASVLCGLRWLRDLRIMVSLEDRRWDEIIAEILEVTSKLPMLRMVISYIPQVEHLERIISLAPPEAETMFKRGRKRLKLVNGGEDIPEIIKKVLGNAGALYLDRHKSIKSLSEFEVHNLQKLQACIVGQCEKMETLIGEGLYSSKDKNPLSEMKELCAYHMSNLTSVCEVKTSFKCYLTIIALYSCPKLTTVFTLSFLASLENLEELIVYDCPQVRTLVSRDDDSSDPTMEDVNYLPNLKRVLLLHLPNLENISNGLAIAPNLERLGFYDCPQLITLSKQELQWVKLEEIQADMHWWYTLRWEGAEQTYWPGYMDAKFSAINEEEDIMHRPFPYNSASSQFNKENWVRKVEYKLTEQQKGSGNTSGLIPSWQNREDMFALLERDLQGLLRLEKQHQTMRPGQHISIDEKFEKEVSDVYDEVDDLRAQYEEKRVWGSPLELMHDRVRYLIRKGLAENIRLSAGQVEGHQISRNAIIGIASYFREIGVKVIGVHGLWRDTRVATMKYLQGNEHVQQLFDKVIFVEGLDVGDHLTIQNAIVDQLKIQLVDGDLDHINGKIHETLKNIKYLLILDAEFESIDDLERLGIPIHNNKNGSKVIVASRYSEFFSRRSRRSRSYGMVGYSTHTVIDVDEIRH